MQKLPEASDRNRGDTCANKSDRTNKKEEAHLLSAVTGRVTTSKSPLLLLEGHMAALKCHVG